MVTNEISSGARPVNGRAPVESVGETQKLGDQFSELLRQLVGDADVSTGFGSAANLGIIQVNVAALAPKTVEAAPKKVEEEPAKETPVQSEEDVEVAADDSEEDEDAVVAEEGVEAAVVVPVVAANQTVTETTEIAKEELPVAAVMKEVVAQGPGADSNTKEDVPGFELNKAVSQQAVATQNVKNDKVEPGSVQQPTESFQQAQTVAVAAGPKSVAARPTEKNPQEDYARLQRILESAAAEETPDSAAPEAPAPQVVKPAVALEKEALRQEAAGQQGALAKLGTEGEQTGVRTTSGRGSSSAGGVEVAFGNQSAALEKAAAKGKTQGALPPKDAQKVVDQLKELLQKAIQNRDGNTISVRLNPPELGQMTVKVTQRDSQVYARIIPESPEVEQALRSRAAEVTQVLVAAGLKADQVLVSIGRERTDGETLQFQQFMGQSGSNTFEDGKERASGGGRERDVFQGNTSYAAEDVVADSGWIA